MISLHTPLDRGRPATSSDARALARTKPGVRIVNCARGGLVDEAALYDAIRSGHVAGAALDVFAEEPARASPLFELDEVVVTPASRRLDRRGAGERRAPDRRADGRLSDHRRGRQRAQHGLASAPRTSPRLTPYMRLADQLGSFAGQLTETRPARRHASPMPARSRRLNTTPLTATVLRGLLAPVMASVNMVNAPLVARERDIAVTTIHQEQTDGYLTLIRLTVETERGAARRRRHAVPRALAADRRDPRHRDRGPARAAHALRAQRRPARA